MVEYTGVIVMQMSRLLETVYILLERKTVTAKTLAEHFEVSQRTIYRDIDTLSAAGIPVFTNKGRGGGIKLLDNYVINKSMISEREQMDILASLQGLNALNVCYVEPVLSKLSVLFNRSSINWVDVDFVPWGSGRSDREKFNLLKEAILERKTIRFDYFNSYRQKSTRVIEPLRLIFKGQGWYIYGFCRNKNDFRLFKVTRIKDLAQRKETFARDVPEDIYARLEDHNPSLVTLVLRLDASMAYRVLDEFDEQCVVENGDGSFTVTVTYPAGEWVQGYILSFGDAVEVLEPPHMRQALREIFLAGVMKYT